MKLWLLTPADSEHGDRRAWSFPSDADPWVPWYDKAFGFVVRAETEEQARQLAEAEAGDESNRGFGRVWTDPRWSTCVELTDDGDAEVVLRDFQRS